MFCLPFCLTVEVGVGAVEMMGSSDKSRMGGNQLQTIMAGFFNHFYQLGTFKTSNMSEEGSVWDVSDGQSQSCTGQVQRVIRSN